jgi:hypothetical protein
MSGLKDHRPLRKKNCGTAISFLLHCDIIVEFWVTHTPPNRGLPNRALIAQWVIEPYGAQVICENRLRYHRNAISFAGAQAFVRIPKCEDRMQARHSVEVPTVYPV